MTRSRRHCLLLVSFLLLASQISSSAIETSVQSFSYYLQAEDFTGVAPVPTVGAWSKVAGPGYFGGTAIQDQTTNTASISYTFHVATNGTYYIWIAHLTDTNAVRAFNCTVEQSGVTVTNLVFGSALASAAKTDTNYVYQSNSWEAWSMRAATLPPGLITLKLSKSALATAPAVVDAFQIVGVASFQPNWDPAITKPFSYHVEAELFGGLTNAPLVNGAYQWISARWNIYAGYAASGGQELLTWGVQPTNAATHTFTVPKAGTYYLWMAHNVNPGLFIPETCAVVQNGATVTNVVFGAHKPQNDRSDPDYHFQNGTWRCWSVHPATLQAGQVTLKVYYNDPSIQSYGMWDRMQIVDDPTFVPQFGSSYGDVPDYSFRVRLDSIGSPNAPNNNNWYALSYYASVHLNLTNGAWSDWLQVTGAVKQSFYDMYNNAYSGHRWPFVSSFIVYPYTVTNMTISVEWQTLQNSGSYSGTYRGGNFVVLLWRDSLAPLPHQMGSVSQYNQRYVDAVNALTIDTNSLPKQFGFVDRWIGVDSEDKAWRDGLGLLRKLGMTVIDASGFGPAKSTLASLGVTKTAGAVYVPPYMFDSDLSKTTDAAMDTWAQGQAAAMTNQGWNTTDVAWYGMSDEPGWYYPYMYTTNAGPDLASVFRTYLQNKGFVPATFGKSTWADVNFLGYSSAVDLPSKRLFYWTARFFPENSANVYSRWARAMERAFYPGMMMPVNWNNFDGQYYRYGGFANNPNPTSPDAAMGSHDWIDFGRQRGVTTLWTEDWFSDASARQWSIYASKLRSGTYHYNDFRTSGSPPAMNFGGYVIGATAGALPGGTLQKVMSILGHGGKSIYYYIFGPEYGFPGNCYSENFGFYPELADAMQVAGKAEDLLYPGQPVRAQVGIVTPQSSQCWDNSSSTPDYMEETFNLYSALQDSHIPADWVDEQDLENNTLSQLKVLYVTSPNLSTNAMAGLQQWIQAGGVAVFTAGAAQYDQYNETNTLFNATLGLAGTPRGHLYYPANTNMLGSITSIVPAGLAAFTTAGYEQALTPTTASVQARFASSSQPAVTMNTVGSGKAIVFGTLVGSAYSANGQTAARSWVAWPVTLAGVVLPVDFNAPKVEAAALQSAVGLAVTLLNWTNTLQNLAVTVRSSQTIGAVQSVKLGASLPFTQIGGVVSFTLPALGPADVVKLYATAAAPLGLTATAVSDNQVALHWTDTSDNELGFRLERSPDGVTGWTEIGTVAANVTEGADSGLARLTPYYYRVCAYNGGGNTAYSNVAPVTTLAGPLEIIVDNADATGVTIVGSWLVANGTPGFYGPNCLNEINELKGQKRVSFAPTVPVAGVYQVYLRWASSSNRATNVPVDILGANGTTRVTVNQRQNGGQWNLLGSCSFAAGQAGSVTVRNDGTDGYVIADAVRLVFGSPPGAPSGLTASAVSTGRLMLSWLDNASNEEGFRIERSPDGSNYQLIATVGAGVTNYLDSGLLPATQYSYRVLAYNSLGGDSGYSNEATATTLAGSAEIIVDNADASGVTVVGPWLAVNGTPGFYGANCLNDGNLNKGQMSVRFTPTLPAGGSYEVYLRWAAAANRASNAPVDIGHVNGTTRVTVNQQQNGGQWNWLGTFALVAGTAGSVTVRNDGTSGCVIADAVLWVPNSSPPAPPAAPSGLLATAVASGQINLSWTDNASNEDGFKVERSTDGSSYQSIGLVSANQTSYADSGLWASRTYSYRVRAYSNAGGDSGYSNEATATTLAGSAEIIVDNADASGVTVVGPWLAVNGTPGFYGVNCLNDGNGNKGQMSVRFAPTLPAGGSYEVYLRWAAAANRASNVPVDIGHVNGTATQWVNQQQNGGQWVRLGTFGFNAGNGGTVTIRTDGTGGYVIADAVRFAQSGTALPAVPAAPTGLTATVVSSSQINLAWTDASTNELGFKVERSLDGSVYQPLAAVLSNVTSYADTGLALGRSYWYRVRAYNAGGDSGYSGVASATTLSEVIVDNADASGVTVVGPWLAVNGTPGFYGMNCLNDGNGNKGQMSVRFAPTLSAGGSYEVYLRWAAAANRATNVPVDIGHVNGTATQWVNQQQNGGQWVWLGTFGFNAGSGGTVTVRTDGTSGYVIADAVRFVQSGTALPAVPAAPTGLTATAISGSQINLGWTDASTNELGFKVERSLDGSVYQPAAVVLSNVNSYADTGLALGRSYWYRVRAYNAGGDSGYSGVASATTLSEVIVDNADASGVTVVGPWLAVNGTAGFYGVNCLNDGNGNKGQMSVRFAPTLPAGGSYEVYLRWAAAANRATTVPVDIVASNGTTRVTVNQQANGGQWNLVGTYTFIAGTAGSVTVRNDGTGGYVIADAVRFVRSGSGLAAGGTASTVAATSAIAGVGLSGASIGTGSSGSSRLLADGSRELTGSGTGFGVTDSLYYEQQTISGDFTVMARIESLTSDGAFPQAGLMIREGLAEDARLVSVAATWTNQYWAARHTLTGTALEESALGSTYVYPDAWVALSRTGDTVTIYTSSDGQDWVEEQTVTVPSLAATVNVGLFISSGTADVPAQAVVTEFGVTR